MRATEFLDFLNRENLDNIENEYHHFDPFIINENGKKVIDKKWLKIRRNYKKDKERDQK